MPWYRLHIISILYLYNVDQAGPTAGPRACGGGGGGGGGVGGDGGGGSGSGIFEEQKMCVRDNLIIFEWYNKYNIETILISQNVVGGRA